jgi:hypothetical protein
MEKIGGSSENVDYPLNKKNPLPGLCKSSPDSERWAQVFQQALED